MRELLSEQEQEETRRKERQTHEAALRADTEAKEAEEMAREARKQETLE